jgi:hypothetical protein
MSWRAVVGNGLVLVGIAAVFVVGTEDGAGALVNRGGSAELAALEADAGRAPTVDAVVRLANAYLDRGQPGLASALLDRLPSELRDRPEVDHAYARALFGRGRAREALAMVKGARDACVDDGSCPAWLVAKTARQLAFLEELCASGIDDPYADPAATMAAYNRSEREVGLVAMR